MHECKKGNAFARITSQTFPSVDRRLAERPSYRAGTPFEHARGMPRDLDDRVFQSLFWLRLIAAKRLLDPAVVADDISEARQLTAILRAIIVKARSSAQRG
jgi:hypothetical protein